MNSITYKENEQMSNYPSEYGIFENMMPPVCRCPICLEQAYDLHDYINCEICGKVLYDPDTNTYRREEG